MISPPKLVTTEEVRAAVIPMVIPGHDMPRYMDPAIRELLEAIGSQGLSVSGPMFSFHQRRPSDTFNIELGFPVSGEVIPVGRVVPGRLPSVQVVRSLHKGPYEGLAQAWPALQAWVRGQGIGSSGRFWESYLNNPDEVEGPAEYLTELNWIVRTA